jgi:uncharacterized protein
MAAKKENPMTNTPHELAADFPEHAARIHELKTADPHFARLMDQYHEINRDVHRAETLVEPMSEEAEAALRKKRAALKDELYRMIRAPA